MPNRNLFFVFVFFVFFLIIGVTSVFAEICTTGTDGWITCQADRRSPEVRATTCDQVRLAGSTCGAGSGCIDPRFPGNFSTGCYNCASQGTCNGFGNTPSGNTCPQGQVWNECASGTNTCVPGEKWSNCKTGSNTLKCTTVWDPNAGSCTQANTCCPTNQVWQDGHTVCNAGREPCHMDWVCNGNTVSGSYDCSYWDRRLAEWIDKTCTWSYCTGETVQMCVGGGACLAPEQWVPGQWVCPVGLVTDEGKCGCQSHSGDYVPSCTGKNDCKGGYSWDNCANNGVNSCQGGCVNLPCNSVAPSVPALTSPASGAQISGTQTNLAGTTPNWGTACSGQSYQFNIYLQQCDAIVTPTTLWKTVTASGNNFNELFTGIGGKGYCWTAEATNGVTTSAKAFPARWTFGGGVPWWQVSGGSVMTFGGVTSLVGQNQKFITDTPGVVISSTGNVFLNGADANANKWVATDANLSQKVSYRYDYDYVSGRIISTIRPNVGPNFVSLPSQLMVAPAQDYGIYWTKVTGNLDINSNLDFGTNKVVVLVEGNANIKGKINFTKNQGLFALYVKGNINIDPSIGTVTGTGVDPTTLPAHIEGLYLAQGSINTGVSASQLRLEGAFVGIGGVNLQRNLNSAWPSEYFVFRPDILVNLPKQLLRQNHIWQELAP